MLRLAWSNLMHRKIRSVLSVLGVAIAVTMLLVLVGLSQGTLNEVSRRMESVDAEILVRDKHFDLGSIAGGKLWEKEIPRIKAIQIDGQPAVRQVIPVFLGRIKLGGLSQNVFGIAPENFSVFAGSRKLLAGRVFTDVPQPDVENITNEPLELILDDRLSRATGLKVGDNMSYADQAAMIAGVVETGVAGRVFAPINRLRGVNGVAAQTAHMFFVKVRPGLTTDQMQILCERIEMATQRQASLVAQYGQVLAENFRNLTIFVTTVSIIALVICFLFILVTMYTIVLERGREIAILQSLGAPRAMILRQTLQESLLICSVGAIVGMMLAEAVRRMIEHWQPLMTVEMRAEWLLMAGFIGIMGGVAGALYPGWMALRHDPVEILSYE
ncbi:MAG: ABC transporter permease [Sedimentisphaerales bacterium]|nr:ABC transporter permease [Sedimentisphaerales bacterium]